MDNGTAAVAASSSVDQQAQRLVSRVAHGELARSGLELLSLAGHRGARRALGQLPLVLTAPPRIELTGAPVAHVAPWIEWGVRLAPFGRALSLKLGLALAAELLPIIQLERRVSRAQLVGLHTGPAGAIQLTDELASRVYPMTLLARGLVDGVRRFQAAPTAASAEAVTGAWPAVMCVQKKAQFLSELVDVDWRAVWALRWLMATASVPEDHAGPAVSCMLGYADEALHDRARVFDVVQRVLLDALLPADETAAPGSRRI